MRKALEIGVDGIEYDVHRSRDGMICRDAQPRRGPHQRRVRLYRGEDPGRAELRTLDVDAWRSPEFAGERIATLEEFVAAIPAPLKLFIELKGRQRRLPEHRGAGDRVPDRPRSGGADQHIIVRPLRPTADAEPAAHGGDQGHSSRPGRSTLWRWRGPAAPATCTPSGSM
ncbi:MAG: hypothetical protein IMX01_10570 [Limnochordaceae bacterium]|nr:hypothetical protein [Limnochordaceae bacterium]